MVALRSFDSESSPRPYLLPPFLLVQFAFESTIPRILQCARRRPSPPSRDLGWQALDNIVSATRAFAHTPACVDCRRWSSRSHLSQPLLSSSQVGITVSDALVSLLLSAPEQFDPELLFKICRRMDLTTRHGANPLEMSS